MGTEGGEQSRKLPGSSSTIKSSIYVIAAGHSRGSPELLHFKARLGAMSLNYSLTSSVDWYRRGKKLAKKKNFMHTWITNCNGELHTHSSPCFEKAKPQPSCFSLLCKYSLMRNGSRAGPGSCLPHRAHRVQVQVCIGGAPTTLSNPHTSEAESSASPVHW